MAVLSWTIAIDYPHWHDWNRCHMQTFLDSHDTGRGIFRLQTTHWSLNIFNRIAIFIVIQPRLLLYAIWPICDVHNYFQGQLIRVAHVQSHPPPLLQIAPQQPTWCWRWFSKLTATPVKQSCCNFESSTTMQAIRAWRHHHLFFYNSDSYHWATGCNAQNVLD